MQLGFLVQMRFCAEHSCCNTRPCPSLASSLEIWTKQDPNASLAGRRGGVELPFTPLMLRRRLEGAALNTIAVQLTMADYAPTIVEGT